MIGACDICNAQNVEIARSIVSGIETFHCAEGCSRDEPTAGPELDDWAKPRIEDRAREFCNGAFAAFGVDTEPYSKIVAELIQGAVNDETARLRGLLWMAILDFEGENGVVLTNPKHWTVQAKAALNADGRAANG